jgi:hypothetical protein
MRRAVFPLLLLAFLLPLIPLTPGVQALQTYTETFEDDIPPNVPTSAFYTFSSNSGTFFTTNNVALGGTSYQQSGTSSQGIFDFEPQNDDFNAANVATKFAYRFLTYSTGFFYWTCDTGCGSFPIAITFEAAGVTKIGGANGAMNPVPITTVIDVWYNVTIVASPATNSFTAYWSNEGVGVTFDGTGAMAADIDMLVFELSGAGNIRIDNIIIQNAPNFPPAAVGASASVSVTSITGFDVHATGSGLIARSGGTCSGGDNNDESYTGACIRHFAPKSLATLGTARNTDCNDGDMVSASDVATVYVVCSDDTDPQFFSIRNFDDSVVDFPGNCDPGDDCLDDIDFESDCSFDDEDSLGEISDLEPIPLDYSYITHDEGLVGDDARAFAVAYSTQNGFVGVFEYTTFDGPNSCNEERISFGGTAPEQISVWQEDEDTDDTLIAAVDSAGATKVYQYSPSIDNQFNELDGTLFLRTTLSPTGGVGISCAGAFCLLVTNSASSNLHLININTGNEATGFPKTVTAEANRGVWLPENGEFFGYVEGSAVIIGNATNATTFASLVIPTGTFFEVQSNQGGQDWWIATTGTPGAIAYYDVYTRFPTIIGSECIPSCVAPNQTVTEDEGLFGEVFGGSPGAQFGNAIGIGEFGGSLVLAGGTIFGMAITGATTLGALARYRSIALIAIGAGVGLIVGFLAAWGLQFLNDGAVFAVLIIAVLLLAAGGFALKRG